MIVEVTPSQAQYAAHLSAATKVRTERDWSISPVLSSEKITDQEVVAALFLFIVQVYHLTPSNASVLPANLQTRETRAPRWQSMCR